MFDIAMRFIMGLGISLGFGWLITMIVHDYLGYYLQQQHTANGSDRFSAAENDHFIFGSHVPLAGTIERTVFAMMTAYNISGTAIAMMIWLGLKAAVGWNEQIKTPSGRTTLLHSLFTGMVSLLFALMGGLFIHAGIR